jgi:hypothetical protein
VGGWGSGGGEEGGWTKGTDRVSVTQVEVNLRLQELSHGSVKAARVAARIILLRSS